MELTDIFGTLGPACEDVCVLSEMLRNGMTGIRLNLSHETLVDAGLRVRHLHEAERLTGIKSKLLVDLQGPELRIGDLAEPLLLNDGALVSIPGEIPFPQILLDALKEGYQLLLDDGKLLLQVLDSSRALVIRGGLLTGRKSIAVPQLELDSPALTGEDLENLSHLREFGVTGVMQPFVRCGADLKMLRSALLASGNENIRVYAKIENQRGIDHLSEILPEADEIVIARGDLGNAMPLWELPAAQKRISALCRKAGKPFMVVTQMLASMEHHPVPTRAEVSDIFNAIVDGASSVMLTGETAVGEHPVDSVRYLAETVRAAHRYAGEQ